MTRHYLGCTCRDIPVAQRRMFWRVRHYRVNHSAFNGYRPTTSAYSQVHCTRCDTVWRTKAGYVELLERQTWAEWDRQVTARTPVDVPSSGALQ